MIGRKYKDFIARVLRGSEVKSSEIKGGDHGENSHKKTKSITNALVGIMAGKGKLAIKEPALVMEWSGPKDPRAAITLDQLLRMSSGLGFVEVYTNLLSDSPFMLFGTADSAGFALSQAFAGPIEG